MNIKQIALSVYFSSRFFQVLGGIILLFILSFFFPAWFIIARIMFLLMLALLAFDAALLYRYYTPIHARRIMAEKLSNGDDNKIIISIRSNFPYPVKIEVIDEIPIQFQLRNFRYVRQLSTMGESLIEYFLKPLKRGEYHFGAINIYVSSPVSFISRRFSLGEGQVAAVYPSFIQMRKYELLAIHSHINEGGLKKQRRMGASTEFEQIREYVQGDEFRRINWKASARRTALMVNNYQEEKAQQVYSIIDKGRVMKMPFEGMSLLDYSINAALVLSNIALLKQDKAGLITFSEKLSAFLPADRKRLQMQKLLSILYNQKSAFRESNYQILAAYLKKKLSHRSLLLMFTNFESLSSLRRQLPYFISLAKNHVLVLIFFENTELHGLLQEHAKNVEQVYIKTIAEKLAFEKRLIVKELERNGIYSILTPPKQLTANTINKYLELKGRGVI